MYGERPEQEQWKPERIIIITRGLERLRREWLGHERIRKLRQRLALRKRLQFWQLGVGQQRSQFRKLRKFGTLRWYE
jgi:hypothetical protein